MPAFLSAPGAVLAMPDLEPEVLPLAAADGARFEALCVAPRRPPEAVLYWLPAMGVSARHYLPLAQSLAERGIAVMLHEWRGIGSSSVRAGWRCNWGYRELLQLDLPAGAASIRARWPAARCYLGGHSLGGQLACLHAALHPHRLAGIALVASGAPYWRCFRRAAWVRLGYVAAPWLAAACGYLPGRRLGFAGNEARGVTADWARSGRSGRYLVRGMPVDFRERLAGLALPVLGVRLHDDWLGPAGSLSWLLRRMPRAARRHQVLTRADLGGAAADHFTWMRAPGPVAERIAAWVASGRVTAP